MRVSSRAMPSGERTKSTHPAAMALRGMPSYLAVESWAKVIPPSAFTACRPRVPSEPVPDRMTPMACAFWSAASDRRK